MKIIDNKKKKTKTNKSNENTPHKINYINILNHKNNKIRRDWISKKTELLGFLKNKHLNDNNNIKIFDNMHLRPESGQQYKFIRDNSNNKIKKHGNHNSSGIISKKEMNLEKIKNNVVEKSNEKEISNSNKLQLIEDILSIVNKQFIIERNIDENVFKKKTNEIYISKLKKSINKLYQSYLNKENSSLKKNLQDLEKNNCLKEEQFNKIKYQINKIIQMLKIEETKQLKKNKY